MTHPSPIGAKALQGKVALVTGGAGGIGAAIARALAAAGATVVVGYNASAAAAEALAASLPGAGHRALAAPVTDTAAIGRLAAEVESGFGRLDILVNCAGTTRFVAHGDLDGLDDELIDRVLAVNVRGPIAMVRAFRKLLAQSGDGLVVNISSIAAVTAMGSNIAYCASKAAVDNLTKSLARALAPQIRVVSVSPGLVDTEFVKGLDPQWRDRQAANTPLARLSAPDEVANAVLAVASLLTFTTGSIIPIDGGRPLL
ncbi:SDR family NAD(P)-dependent oxidoreductase [Kaistia defluvii]|uniref:SDR family NAD(P)-dependent oxidoreductase n=1 Tax=Kaistia defluvii TaxID=410841 RepID=UPI002252B17A|nr:SDR family oxidoreductase [Kaistia defluvii]MCX5518919.1 SDR family NAD(P)-dependent oxidoreductase [Kaistia defluvii]